MDEEITNKILNMLDRHRTMTIATLRPDGWPQATTVGCHRHPATRLAGLEQHQTD